MHARQYWRISFCKSISHSKLQAFTIENFPLSNGTEGLNCVNIINCMSQTQFFFCSSTQGQLTVFISAMPQATGFQQVYQGNYTIWLQRMLRAKVIIKLTRIKDQSRPGVSFCFRHDCCPLFADLQRYIRYLPLATEP